ncbi:uncharacterized protein LOC106172806 [Lingula anatina]|uniref:DNA 3'-5' helicase n=1 Tax=Lingula anatina TaxID=7574 RepID=A0A1S3JFH1_LINAN|nr:uncharacterized protein LOC106172806 [Lingula anatina]|eukprot:XP_013409162.1 uncharacterized protein LOC106172806 [Lingula anatina]
MIVLVVSPLNSLIQDQISNLRRVGIAACTINISGTKGMTYNEAGGDEVSSDDEEGNNLEDRAVLECDVPFDMIEKGAYKIIYAHPETFQKTKFAQVIRRKVYQELVCAVVIDEVHMISEWGDDFRPAFKKLGELICVFDGSRHLVLTATATPAAVKSLVKLLNFKDHVVVSANVDRPNIYIEICKRLPNIHKFEKLDGIIQPIAEELKEKQHDFPVTIINVDNLESLGYFYQFVSYHLQEKGYKGEQIPQNRIFGQYHKDYPDDMKQLIIGELVKPNPTIRLVMATVALGMGINAPSVERIIHSRPPTTLEKYQQEIGRAGRAGQPAHAIMYYNNSDIAKNRKGLSDVMAQFCKQDGCYRRTLVNYFGFDEVLYKGERHNCCSNCRGSS